MIDLLKAFGRGVLYVVLLPFFLAALVLFAVIGLGDFIFQIVRSIIYFFTGQKFFPELPEDRELRLRRENAQARAMAAEQPINNSDAFRDSPIFHDYQETPVASKEQPVVTPMNNERPLFEDVPPVKEEPKEDLSNLLNDNPMPEPAPQPQPQPEPVFRQPNNQQDELIKPSFEQNQHDEEVLETYRPKEASFSGQIDVDDDNNNGVDIGFDE